MSNTEDFVGRLVELLEEAGRSGWSASLVERSISQLARDYGLFWGGSDLTFGVGIRSRNPLTGIEANASAYRTAQEADFYASAGISFNNGAGGFIEINIDQLQLATGVQYTIDAGGSSFIIGASSSGAITVTVQGNLSQMLGRRGPAGLELGVTTVFLDTSAVLNRYSDLFREGIDARGGGESGEEWARNIIYGILESNQTSFSIPEEQILFASRIQEYERTGRRSRSYTSGEAGSFGFPLNSVTVVPLEGASGYYTVRGIVTRSQNGVGGASIQEYEAIIDSSGRVIDGWSTIRVTGQGNVGVSEFLFAANWDGTFAAGSTTTLNQQLQEGNGPGQFRLITSNQVDSSAAQAHSSARTAARDRLSTTAVRLGAETSAIEGEAQRRYSRYLRELGILQTPGLQTEIPHGEYSPILDGIELDVDPDTGRVGGQNLEEFVPSETGIYDAIDLYFNGPGRIYTGTETVAGALLFTELLSRVPVEYLHTIRTSVSNGNFNFTYQEAPEVLVTSSTPIPSSVAPESIPNVRIERINPATPDLGPPRIVVITETGPINVADGPARGAIEMSRQEYDPPGPGPDDLPQLRRTMVRVRGGIVVTPYTRGPNGMPQAGTPQFLPDQGYVSLSDSIGETEGSSSNKLTEDQIEELNQGFDYIDRLSVYGSIGSIIGSTVGSVLADQIDFGSVGNEVADVVSSAVFGQIGTAFGRALAGNADSESTVGFLERLDGELDEAFGTDALVTSLADAAIGTVSSLLTAELTDGLGLNGAAADLFGRASNAVIRGVGTNVFHEITGNAFGQAGESIFDFEFNPAAIIGGFIGNRLASAVVSPQTQAAVILSSLGSSISTLALGSKVGAAIGSAIPGLGTLVGGVLGYAVAAFVGQVLGTLIGNLFGRKKPKIPQASADTVLSFVDGYYTLGTVTSRDNGNEALVTDMANSAADTLNGIIDIMRGFDGSGEVINTVSPTQTYGHINNELYVRVGGTRTVVQTADEALDIGVVSAIRSTQVAGGNLIIKRAIEKTDATILAQLGGELQFAEDYTTYLQNQETIDAAIAAPYNSLSETDKQFYENNLAYFEEVQRHEITPMSSTRAAWSRQTQPARILETLNSVSTFAAGWIVTLQRAAELGLNQSAASDFYGGAKGFVDSLQGLLSAPLEYEDTLFFVRGADLEVYRDDDGNGRADSRFDSLAFDETGFLRAAGHADGGVGYHRAFNNSEMTNGNDIITNASGAIDDLTTQTVTTPGYFVPSGNYGYWVPESTSTQTIEGGDDIITGNSSNNNFNGRSGNDWLDGGAGNDVLRGGTGDDVLLGRSGNDGFYGDDGDDYLSGGAGNDYLRGGNGNDSFRDGTGVDGLDLGNGDDTVYLSDDGNTDRIFGRSGHNIVSYSLFGRGVEVDLAERGTRNNNTAHHGWKDTHAARAYGGDGYGNDFYDIHGLEGSQFGDELTGNSENNTLRGLGGDDTLSGGAGNDVLEGGAGADTLIRTSGTDEISYRHSSGGVDVSIHWLDSLGGQHAFGGDASGDVFQGHFMRLTGSDFADVLEGNHGSNVLNGLDGDDYFIATRGSDQFWGGEGFDTVDYGNHAGPSGLSINAINGQRTYGYLNGVHGASGYSRSWDVEHVVGTQHADTIRFGAGDNVLEGGAGNDTLYGGAGNDTYFVELGGGSDRIYEYGNQGHDTIMVGYDENLSWDGVFIGAGANLSIRANGQLLATAYNSPSEHREEVGVDAVDIGGVGAIDLWYITGGSWTSGAGWASSNTLRGYGDERGFSLLQGGDGNDTIWSASNSSGSKTYETNSNILHGGRGNDTIYASVGDDQYIFDRGSGRDTVRDTGGLDHIQFGPGVALEELVFTVVGNDLYIGVAPEGTTDTSGLNANQMSDYMRIVGGGKQIVTHGGSTYSGNLIEYITVQNVNVDIRTLDLDWTIEDQTEPTNPTNPGYPSFPDYGGGLPNIPPIMFDLDGDGLELVSVDESRIVVRGDDKSLTRVGWLGADDGFLALDRDGDGKITSLSEVSFAQDLEGAETDLEGLRAYDTNEDGVFDAQDERFGEFRVWQDRNQNGRGGRRELMTLEEAGITSISLDGTSTGNEITNFADNVILNTTEVGMSDGTTSVGYDVALASTVIREGRESATAYIGQSDDVLDGRLGRISVRRLEHLLAKQAAKNDTTTVMPIVFDLNGDGELALSHLSESGVSIDVDSNGVGDSIGWVGAEDGLLGLDRDGDGSITAVSEISFVQDLEGAQTDLEGLVAFDSNGDGVLSADDARFADFRIWQDVNQDGISQSGELRSLEEAGVTSINLTAHVGRQTSDEDAYLDNVVFGHTAVQWADGSETIAGDVGLRVQYAGLTDSETGEDAFITGFAGLEHVHVDSAATMASITLDTDWGKIAGGRSPLMARLYAADAERARLDALGTDTGLTQDELLADFDSDDEGDGETDAEDTESSADAGSDAVTDTEVANEDDEGGEADTADTSSDMDATFKTETEKVMLQRAEYIAPDNLLPGGYELKPHIVHGTRIRDIITRQTLASTVEATSVVAEASLPELDRFTQAMAGFGAQSSFAGLQVADKEEGRFNDIIGTQTRSSLMAQLS